MAYTNEIENHQLQTYERIMGTADPFLPEIFGGIMSVFTNNRTCNKNLIGDMAKKENNELEKRNQAF